MTIKIDTFETLKKVFSLCELKSLRNKNLNGKNDTITTQKVSVFGVILVRIFPAFSHIRTECGEIQIISPYSVRILENAGKWTLLTQCIYFPWKVYSSL